MTSQMGKLLITLGFVLIVVGLIFVYRDKFPLLKSIGQLPGDLSIKRENFSLYFPITTSILLSVALSLAFWLLNKLGK